jgi:hypothetical protein
MPPQAPVRSDSLAESGGFEPPKPSASFPRLMLPHGRGCIFFTGATASLRGGDSRMGKFA